MNRFGIGQPVRRVEDARFLTGRSRYVDDIQLPQMLHGAVVMSPHAHARIRSIDAKPALESPGVVAVLTGEDAKKEGLGGIPPLFMPEDMGGPKGYRTFRPLLEPAKARYVGDRIAFVVADTPEQARIAAERVEVDYEPLPRRGERRRRGQGRRAEGLGRQRRGQPGVPAHDGQQGGDRRGVREGEAQGVGAPLQQPHHRERHGAARRDRRLQRNEDAYTLYTSSQNPHGVRSHPGRRGIQASGNQAAG